MQENVVALAPRDFAFAALLALAVAAGGAARMVPGVIGVFHDDAVYTITAKALAEGEGYRLTNLPTAPAQTKYPVLYPAILSVAWRAAASSSSAQLVAVQAVTLACAAIALAAMYLHALRFGLAGRASAFAGGLLAASAPNLLFYCAQPVSEMPFAAFTILALSMSEQRLRGAAGGPARDLATGFALGLPFLCRVVGIVVPVAVLGVLAVRRIPVRWIAAGVVLAIAPWIAWLAYWRGATDAVVGYQTSYFSWWLTNEPLSSLVMNVGKLFVAFSHVSFEALAWALYARVDSTRAILTAVGAIPWVVVAMRCRSLSLLPVTLAVYFVVVCFWPWPPDRFLIPVLPLLAMLSFEQLRRMVVRVASPGIAAAAILIAALVPIATNVRLLSTYVSASRTSHYPYFLPSEDPVSWASYEEAFDWLESHTEASDVIASGFDSMTALYTGRPTIRPFVPRPRVLYYGQEGAAVGTVDELDRTLVAYRPRYFFLSPMPAFPEEEPVYELVAALIREHPERLRPAYRGSDPRFLVYEVALGEG
jgi:hypothetical protein